MAHIYAITEIMLFTSFRRMESFNKIFKTEAVKGAKRACFLNPILLFNVCLSRGKCRSMKSLRKLNNVLYHCIMFPWPGLQMQHCPERSLPFITYLVLSSNSDIKCPTKTIIHHAPNIKFYKRFLMINQLETKSFPLSSQYKTTFIDCPSKWVLVNEQLVRRQWMAILLMMTLIIGTRNNSVGSETPLGNDDIRHKVIA